MRTIRSVHVVSLAAFVLFVLCVASLTLHQPAHVEAQSFAASIPCYVHTATATPCKDGSGVLQNIVINGGTAGTVTLYDIAAASCTGTPGSGKFATIETIGTTNPVSLAYNNRFLNGLCIVTAQATDVTVGVQ